MNPDTLRPIVPLSPGDAGPGSGANSTRGGLAQAKETVTTAARDTAARIKVAAGETAGRAKEKAQQLASDAKQNTADRIGGYSSAIHESAKSFEEQDPNIAWATHGAANRLQQLADYIRNRDFDDLKADAETVARRHPVAFFGGMLIAGLVVGNLLKARRPAEDMTEDASEEMMPGSNETGATMPDSPATAGL